jgi:hypothetical protein
MTMSEPVYPEDALSQDPNPEGEDVDPDFVVSEAADVNADVSVDDESGDNVGDSELA